MAKEKIELSEEADVFVAFARYCLPLLQRGATAVGIEHVLSDKKVENKDMLVAMSARYNDLI